MGRPVNKRYFGSGAGNQIKVRAKIGSNAEGDGFIVSQRSSNKFKVTVGANTGVCTLVNKDTGTLGANEMIINVYTDAGTWRQATKLYNRVAIVEGTTKVKWTFATSNTDNAVEVPDVEENAYTKTITISGQPVSVTTSTGSSASFTVTASGVTDIAYQWQSTTATVFTNIVGATSSTYSITTATTDATYRVVVSSVSNQAAPVTSNTATLTVTL